MKLIISLFVLIFAGCTSDYDCHGDETDLMSCCMDFLNDELDSEHSEYYAASCDGDTLDDNIDYVPDTGTDSGSDDPVIESTRFRVQVFSATFSDVNTGGVGELTAPKVTACMFLLENDDDLNSCTSEEPSSFTPIFNMTVETDVLDYDTVLVTFKEAGEDPILEIPISTPLGRHELPYSTLQSLSGTGQVIQTVDNEYTNDVYRRVLEVTMQVDTID